MKGTTLPVSVIVLTLIGSVTAAIGGSWQEYDPPEREALVPKSRASGVYGKPRFLVVLDNGAFVYANKDIGEIRRRAADGAVVKFSETGSFTLDPMRLNRAKESDSSRRRLYQAEPVTTTLTNVKRSGEGLVLLHEFRPKSGKVRVVQYLDQKLQTVRIWEDRWPIFWKSSTREPLAIDNKNRVVSTGEPGEILVYTPQGAIMERLVFPGVFNETRKLEAVPLSAEVRKYISEKDAELFEKIDAKSAEYDSKRLLERDVTLPQPIRVTGDLFPVEVVDLAFAGDGRLLILDGKSQVYALNMGTHVVEMLRIEDWKMKGEKEKVVQIRATGDYLFELTDYRLLQISLKPKPRVVADVKVPEGSGGPLAAWDVAPMKPEKNEGSLESPGIEAYFSGILGGDLQKILFENTAANGGME